MTSLLYKNLPTNLGVCKSTFCNFYTSHLRSNSTMRCCIYRKDLGQNVVFHNFFKTNCTQSIFRMINRKLLAKPFKIFPKSPIRPAGSHLYQTPNLQCDLWSSVWMNINGVTLQRNIKRIYFVCFFLSTGFMTIYNLKKRLMCAAFCVLLQVMFMNNWEQTAPRLKL